MTSRRRWLVALCAQAGCSQAAFAAFRVLITYRALELGLNALQIGILAAATALTPAVLALPVGRLVDRGAAKRALLFSTVAMVGAGLLVTGSRTVALLLASCVVVGVAQVSSSVAGQGYASIASDRHDLDRHFSFWSLSTNLGQVAGLATVALVFTVVDASRSSVITIASMVVLCLAFASGLPLLALSALDAVPRAEGSAAISLRRVLGVEGIPTAVFASMVILAGVDLLVVYLPVVAEQHDISVQIVTGLLAARIVASMLARMVLPHVLTRFDRRAVLISATLCSGSGLVMLPIAALFVPALALCLVVIGTFWGFGQPMTMTWVVSLVPQSEQGAALATRTLANSVAQTALPLGAGALASVAGVSIVFVLAGALSLVASAATAGATRC